MLFFLSTFLCQSPTLDCVMSKRFAFQIQRHGSDAVNCNYSVNLFDNLIIINAKCVFIANIFSGLGVGKMGLKVDIFVIQLKQYSVECCILFKDGWHYYYNSSLIIIFLRCHTPEYFLSQFPRNFIV